MSAVTFDTHKVIKQLESAGLPPSQAEAIVAAVTAAQEGAELVTKKDLQLALAELRADLIKWVVGLALAQLALLIGILTKLL